MDAYENLWTAVSAADSREWLIFKKGSAMTNEIQQVEKEIFELVNKLDGLRKVSTPVPVKNYAFRDLGRSNTTVRQAVQRSVHSR